MLSIVVPIGAGSRGFDGFAPRLLAATSAVLLLLLVAGAFVVVRAVEDRRLAEEGRREAERSALAPRIETPHAEEPPPVPPPDPAPRANRPEPDPPPAPSALADEERGRLLAEIARLAEIASRPVAPSLPAADDGLARALGIEIDRTLSELVKAPPGETADLRGALALGPVVLPLLSPHFRDPDEGPFALRIAGSLAGVRIDDLVGAAAGAGLAGAAHVEALARALADVARAGDLEGLIRVASREGLEPPIGLAAIQAISRFDDPRAGEAVAAGIRRSPEERRLAIALLADRLPGREILLGLLDDGGLSPEAAGLVVRALLPDARADEGPCLGRALVAGGSDAAIGIAVGEEAVPGIVAELLHAPWSEARKQLLGQVLGLEGAGRKDLLRAAFSMAPVTGHLRTIARERGPAPPSTAAEVMARAELARPIDVPGLLDALDAVAPESRARVAAAAAALGHPEGRAVLRRLACRQDPDVRARVAEAVVLAELGGDADLLTRLLGDEDARVRSRAAQAFEAMKLELDPANGVAALATLGSTESGWVLRAMLRREGSRESLTSLLIDALDRGAVRDAHAAARTLFEINADAGPEYAARFLGHAEPWVRATALEAVGRAQSEDPGRWVSVIDRISADPDARVRVAAARAFGRTRDEIARVRLMALVRDASWLVREAALLGLMSHDELPLVPIFRRATEDPHPIVANAARVALVRHGLSDVAAYLLADLADPAVAGRTRAALLALVGARDLEEAALAAEVERLAGASSRPR